MQPSDAPLMQSWGRDAISVFQDMLAGCDAEEKGWRESYDARVEAAIEQLRRQRESSAAGAGGTDEDAAKKSAQPQGAAKKNRTQGANNAHGGGGGGKRGKEDRGTTAVDATASGTGGALQKQQQLLKELRDEVAATVLPPPVWIEQMERLKKEETEFRDAARVARRAAKSQFNFFSSQPPSAYSMEEVLGERALPEPSPQFGSSSSQSTTPRKEQRGKAGDDATVFVDPSSFTIDAYAFMRRHCKYLEETYAFVPPRGGDGALPATRSKTGEASTGKSGYPVPGAIDGENTHTAAATTAAVPGASNDRNSANVDFAAAPPGSHDEGHVADQQRRLLTTHLPGQYSASTTLPQLSHSVASANNANLVDEGSGGNGFANTAPCRRGDGEFASDAADKEACGDSATAGLPRQTYRDLLRSTWNSAARQHSPEHHSAAAVDASGNRDAAPDMKSKTKATIRPHPPPSDQLSSSRGARQLARNAAPVECSVKDGSLKLEAVVGGTARAVFKVWNRDIRRLRLRLATPTPHEWVEVRTVKRGKGSSVPVETPTVPGDAVEFEVLFTPHSARYVSESTVITTVAVGYAREINERTRTQKQKQQQQQQQHQTSAAADAVDSYESRSDQWLFLDLAVECIIIQPEIAMSVTSGQPEEETRRGRKRIVELPECMTFGPILTRTSTTAQLALCNRGSAALVRLNTTTPHFSVTPEWIAFLDNDSDNNADEGQRSIVSADSSDVVGIGTKKPVVVTIAFAAQPRSTVGVFEDALLLSVIDLAVASSTRTTTDAIRTATEGGRGVYGHLLTDPSSLPAPLQELHIALRGEAVDPAVRLVEAGGEAVTAPQFESADGFAPLVELHDVVPGEPATTTFTIRNSCPMDMPYRIACKITSTNLVKLGDSTARRRSATSTSSTDDSEYSSDDDEDSDEESEDSEGEDALATWRVDPSPSGVLPSNAAVMFTLTVIPSVATQQGTVSGSSASKRAALQGSIRMLLPTVPVDRDDDDEIQRVAERSPEDEDSSCFALHVLQFQTVPLEESIFVAPNMIHVPGSCLMGVAHYQTIQLSSNSPYAVPFSLRDDTSSDAVLHTLVFEPSEGVIPPGEAVEVRVRCVFHAIGEHDVRVLCDSPGRTESVRSRVLEMHASVVGPSLELSPDTLDFGLLQEGEVGELPLTLINPNPIPVTLHCTERADESRDGARGAEGAQFTFTPSRVTLAPNESRDVVVRRRAVVLPSSHESDDLPRWNASHYPSRFFIAMDDGSGTLYGVTTHAIIQQARLSLHNTIVYLPSAPRNIWQDVCVELRNESAFEIPFLCSVVEQSPHVSLELPGKGMSGHCRLGAAEKCMTVPIRIRFDCPDNAVHTTLAICPLMPAIASSAATNAHDSARESKGIEFRIICDRVEQPKLSALLSSTLSTSSTVDPAPSTTAPLPPSPPKEFVASASTTMQPPRAEDMKAPVHAALELTSHIPDDVPISTLPFRVRARNESGCVIPFAVRAQYHALHPPVEDNWDAAEQRKDQSPTSSALADSQQQQRQKQQQQLSIMESLPLLRSDARETFISKQLSGTGGHMDRASAELHLYQNLLIDGRGCTTHFSLSDQDMMLDSHGAATAEAAMLVSLPGTYHEVVVIDGDCSGGVIELPIKAKVTGKPVLLDVTTAGLSTIHGQTVLAMPATIVGQGTSKRTIRVTNRIPRDIVVDVSLCQSASGFAVGALNPDDPAECVNIGLLSLFEGLGDNNTCITTEKSAGGMQSVIKATPNQFFLPALSTKEIIVEWTPSSVGDDVALEGVWRGSMVITSNIVTSKFNDIFLIDEFYRIHSEKYPATRTVKPHSIVRSTAVKSSSTTATAKKAPSDDPMEDGISAAAAIHPSSTIAFPVQHPIVSRPGNVVSRNVLLKPTPAEIGLLALAKEDLHRKSLSAAGNATNAEEPTESDSDESEDGSDSDASSASRSSRSAHGPSKRNMSVGSSTSEASVSQELALLRMHTTKTFEEVLAEDQERLELHAFLEAKREEERRRGEEHFEPVELELRVKWCQARVIVEPEGPLTFNIIDRNFGGPDSQEGTLRHRSIIQQTRRTVQLTNPTQSTIHLAIDVEGLFRVVRITNMSDGSDSGQQGNTNTGRSGAMGLTTNAMLTTTASRTALSTSKNVGPNKGESQKKNKALTQTAASGKTQGRTTAPLTERSIYRGKVIDARSSSPSGPALAASASAASNATRNDTMVRELQTGDTWVADALEENGFTDQPPHLLLCPRESAQIDIEVLADVCDAVTTRDGKLHISFPMTNADKKTTASLGDMPVLSERQQEVELVASLETARVECVPQVLRFYPSCPAASFATPYSVSSAVMNQVGDHLQQNATSLAQRVQLRNHSHRELKFRLVPIHTDAALASAQFAMPTSTRAAQGESVMRLNEPRYTEPLKANHGMVVDDPARFTVTPARGSIPAASLGGVPGVADISITFHEHAITTFCATYRISIDDDGVEGVLPRRSVTTTTTATSSTSVSTPTSAATVAVSASMSSARSTQTTLHTSDATLVVYGFSRVTEMPNGKTGFE